MIRETHQILGDSAGTSHELTMIRFRPDQPTAKIYLQAALHADEQPGMLVLHHLITRLEQAKKKGLLKAEIVLLPLVNPLGMTHLAFGTHRGRYHPVNAMNYNRHWPDLDALIHQDSEDLSHGFSNNPDENQRLIRQIVKSKLEAQTPVTALERLRHMVMMEAYDADMVLDLHCDDDALNHIYIVPQLMPDYQDLSDWMGSAATMTAEDSGGGSFDEVWPGLWIKLARRYPDVAWPKPVLSATLEYRGLDQVAEEMNKQDADNLYQFLVGRGMIDDHPLTPPSAPPALPLTALEYLRADRPCLMIYHLPLGSIVQKGDVIAEMLEIEGEGAFTTKRPLKAGTDGVLFALNLTKLAWPDHIVAKIAGRQPLEGKGVNLLSD
ncbi:MAG: succinylglutamate desuccinylase [Alphaproteobacteria bacterium]|nr:succinylglutamate desuccinylase [Alphaproteobacteria bacterium]